MVARAQDHTDYAINVLNVAMQILLLIDRLELCNFFIFFYSW